MTSMKWRACSNPISVVSLLLAVVLVLAGVGCSAISSPASDAASSTMSAGTALSVGQPEDNATTITIADVAAIEAKVHSKSGHARWTEERRVARYRERTVPEPWR